MNVGSGPNRGDPPNRWDRNLTTLHRRLRDGDVRTDLIWADGIGRFERFLQAEDIVRDEM